MNMDMQRHWLHDEAAQRERPKACRRRNGERQRHDNEKTPVVALRSPRVL
jgi:hypothetical protein